MSAIWSTDENGAWRLVAPHGFSDEATLHTMVEQAPQMLPLSGTPQMVVLGREVQLGGNYADLLAVEPGGRLVVIEVKLAKNPEARRAVIAQILTYAAFLRGMDIFTLEQVLKKHLAGRAFASVSDAVQSADQTGSFDEEAFTQGLGESLAQGAFRLVLVLDDAPAELVRLVGYLEAVTEGLLIDLVTVSSYAVGGATVVVPQRIDPELQPRSLPPTLAPAVGAARPQGEYTEGAAEFLASFAQAPLSEQSKLSTLAEWAIELEKQGLVRLGTYRGRLNRWTLLPRIPGTGAGLVTVWNEKGAALQFWRSVFVKRAPAALPALEALLAPLPVGQGNNTRNITPELLDLLSAAYREAATGETLLP